MPDSVAPDENRTHMEWPFAPSSPQIQRLEKQLDSKLKGLNAVVIADMKKLAVTFFENLKMGSSQTAHSDLVFAQNYLEVLTHLELDMDWDRRAQDVRVQLRNALSVTTEQQTHSALMLRPVFQELRIKDINAHNAMLLKYVLEYTLEETQERMGLSKQQVRTALERGKRFAKEFLNSDTEP